jgi:hypothetical protein
MRSSTAGLPPVNHCLLSNSSRIPPGGDRHAHRALSLLTDWGLIDVSRGQRATVRVSVSGEDSHNRNNMAHTTMNASLTNIKMTARTQRRRRHSYGKLPYADPTAVAIRVDMCARILTSLTHSGGTCSR